MKPFLNSLPASIDRNRRLNVSAMVILLFKNFSPSQLQHLILLVAQMSPFIQDAAPKKNLDLQSIPRRAKVQSRPEINSLSPKLTAEK